MYENKYKYPEVNRFIAKRDYCRFKTVFLADRISVLETGWAFKHQDLQICYLKFNKYEFKYEFKIFNLVL